MLLSSVQFLFEFYNAAPLQDSVSYESLVARNNSDVILLDDNLGYVMKNSQYLEGNNFAFNVSNGMMMNFWLYSVNPGMTLDVNQNVTSIEMPIIDLVESSSISSTNPNYIFSVYESTYTEGRNYLTVELKKGTSEYYRVSSEYYSVGMWHNIFVVYDGLNVDNELKIYIDGTLQSLQDISGNIGGSNVSDLSVNPSSPNIDIFINRNFDDYYSNNRTGNYGYIDNILVLNNANIPETIMQVLINSSLAHAVDDTYINTVRDRYAISFDDPSTFTINSMADDMLYTYFARNDGKILRGSSLLWESRKVFSDKKEVDLLQERVVGGNDLQKAVVEDGFLKIENSVIRL